jgi:hypothetical protein
MLQDAHIHGGEAGVDFGDVFPAGVSAKGEFHCSDCGYGVTVFRELPSCPMCGGDSWEQSTWSPFRRPEYPA